MYPYTLSCQCNGGRVGKKQCQGTPIILPPLYRQERVWGYPLFIQIRGGGGGGDQCLTDAHMRIAAQLLKKQFLEQKGLQDTIFVAESRAKRQGPGSVQIHHNGSNHWVIPPCGDKTAYYTTADIQEKRFRMCSKFSYWRCMGPVSRGCFFQG